MIHCLDPPIHHMNQAAGQAYPLRHSASTGIVTGGRPETADERADRPSCRLFRYRDALFEQVPSLKVQVGRRGGVDVR